MQMASLSATEYRGTECLCRWVTIHEVTTTPHFLVYFYNIQIKVRPCGVKTLASAGFRTLTARR